MKLSEVLKTLKNQNRQILVLSGSEILPASECADIGHRPVKSMWMQAGTLYIELRKESLKEMVERLLEENRGKVLEIEFVTGTVAIGQLEHSKYKHMECWRVGKNHFLPEAVRAIRLCEVTE